MKEQTIIQFVDHSFILEPEKIRHNALKRTFDILFSLTALFFGLPIFLIISLAIRLSSKGQVIYGHERIGRGGTSFRCYKFRTMYPDADARLKELLESHPTLKQEWEQTHKLRNDPRITPIGQFLRKTSLDELPQFWNVLKGDLSVVGPRPVIKAELKKYFANSSHIILSVRPGLTGLWQVSGRSNISYAERVRLDKEYVDNQSILLDIKLIAKTIPVMLFSKGAY